VFQDQLFAADIQAQCGQHRLAFAVAFALDHKCQVLFVLSLQIPSGSLDCRLEFEHLAGCQEWQDAMYHNVVIVPHVGHIGEMTEKAGNHTIS
jgi:hypothetical protein